MAYSSELDSTCSFSGPTVGYYVYSDAEKRGLKNPQLRGIVLGFLGILGLLIHLGMVQQQD
jgi:hypothetical protein